jgi:hypothetical protein
VLRVARQLLQRLALPELRAEPAEVGGQAQRCQAIVAQTGRCGDLQFTRLGFGFGTTTRYYDAGSALVAVRATTDAVNTSSACPDWKHYGRRLSCTDAIVEDFCRR